MKNSPNQTPEPAKQRILEQTLLAVKDRKRQRKTTHTAALCIIIVFVVIAASPFFQSPTTSSAQDKLTENIIPPNVSPDSNPPLHYDVSMVENGGIKTMVLSLSDISEILFYQPKLRFSATDHAYTWENRDMMIYVNRPDPTLDITDPLSSLNL